MDTNETVHIREPGVLILGVKLQLHAQDCSWGEKGVLNREVSSFQGCPKRDVPPLQFVSTVFHCIYTWCVAGILERNPAGWRVRFKCLNNSSSCHRHITRMFKFLGEVDHEKYKVVYWVIN